MTAEAAHIGEIYHHRSYSYLRRAGQPVRTGLLHKRNNSGEVFIDLDAKARGSWDGNVAVFDGDAVLDQARVEGGFDGFGHQDIRDTGR